MSNPTDTPDDKNPKVKLPFGAIVGRFGPLHDGHVDNINIMFETCEQALIIIGSYNAAITWRYMFTFEQRYKMLHEVFPEARIIGLGDFKDDDDAWLYAIDRILLDSGMVPEETTFFGGCKQELSTFTEHGRLIRPVNRFDGTTKPVSATQVRDALDEGRPITGLVPPVIESYIIEIFHEQKIRLKQV